MTLPQATHRAEATRWWWVRHAPVPDPEGRILGRLDVACDCTDTDAFALLAERLPRGAALLVSPLLRARQTADALDLAGAGLAPAQEDDALIEQDFGAWQGQTWGGLASAHPPNAVLEAFWHRPGEIAPPGGERFAATIDRVARAVDRWSDRLGPRDVVVISHAGPIRAAVAQALGLTPDTALRLVIDPLSVTRIDRFAGEPVGWALNRLNETLP